MDTFYKQQDLGLNCSACKDFKLCWWFYPPLGTLSLAGWVWGVDGVFLRETYIPNFNTLLCLKPLENVLGGWLGCLNSILVFSLTIYNMGLESTKHTHE